MTTPNVIGKPTVTYNTLLTREQLDRLKSIAHRQSRRRAKRVSAASLIREAVDQYLEKADDRR